MLASPESRAGIECIFHHVRTKIWPCLGVVHVVLRSGPLGYFIFSFFPSLSSSTTVLIVSYSSTQYSLLVQNLYQKPPLHNSKQKRNTLLQLLLSSSLNYQRALLVQVLLCSRHSHSPKPWLLTRAQVLSGATSAEENWLRVE